MNNNWHKRVPFHYGWIIVGTGMLCIFASLGFGRFALGMLLPSMASSLDLSYSQIGFISTGNFVGYLIAVFLSGHLASRTGSRALIFYALTLTGISMFLISRSQTFFSLMVLYFLTGMGSGASNVPMMGLVSAWFSSSIRGKAAGFVVIGSGFAIIISGKLIPFINSAVGTEGWRLSWVVLGIIVLFVALVCLITLRNRPSNLGLVPAGTRDAISSSPHPYPDALRHASKGVIYLLGSIYFLFGYTYVIYVTFIVTTLVLERGFSESVAGNFWSWVGFLSLFSGPVFGTLSDRLGRKAGLIIVFSLQTIAYLLVASNLPAFSLYLSIFFFGIVAWAIPSIMIATVADYVEPEKVLPVFGFITFIFGLGQISGPAVAGALAETAGSFSGSFFMAAFFAFIAMVLTALLKRPRRS